jgi:tetratricopeptide (TPR) repeat protein
VIRDQLQLPSLDDPATHSSNEPLASHDDPLYHQIDIEALWRRAIDLTARLDPARRYSTPTLAQVLARRLGPGYEQLTKSKIDYLRGRGVLQPESGGTERKSWRYTLADARFVLVAEILKKEYHLDVPTIARVLCTFREERLGDARTQMRAQRTTNFEYPSPITHVYNLLRNRAMGGLLVALADGQAKDPPARCLVAIRLATQEGHTNQGMSLPRISWERAKMLLGEERWRLAIAEETRNLTFYFDFVGLETHRQDLFAHFPFYQWWLTKLRDENGDLFDLVVGLPKRDLVKGPATAIAKSLDWGTINVHEKYRGLATVLRAAFLPNATEQESPATPGRDTETPAAQPVNGGTSDVQGKDAENGTNPAIHYPERFAPVVGEQRNEGKGVEHVNTAAHGAMEETERGHALRTRLDIFAELVADSLDLITYCTVLVPEDVFGTVGDLIAIGSSSSSPHTSGAKEPVPQGRFLSGWSYKYGIITWVTDAIEHDARIAHPAPRERAAAAAPALVVYDRERTVLGVVYVGSMSDKEVSEPDEAPQVFTEETLAALEIFGYVCGDLLARNQLEVQTVRSIGRRVMLPKAEEAGGPTEKVRSLHELLGKAVDFILQARDTSTHALNFERRLFLLTFTTKASPSSVSRYDRWLRAQGAKMIRSALANNLDSTQIGPLPLVEYVEEPDHLSADSAVEPERSVFLVRSPIRMSEEECRRWVRALRRDLELLRVTSAHPGFYPWAITFPIADLFSYHSTKGRNALVEYLLRYVRGPLEAAPHLIEGHLAVLDQRLDLAVSEFRRALDTGSGLWYARKQIAYVEMLQGDFASALRECKLALDENPEYASAYALQADCTLYSDPSKYISASLDYERALAYSKSAAAKHYRFIVRYGEVLANLDACELEKLIGELNERTESFPYLQKIYLKVGRAVERACEGAASSGQETEREASEANQDDRDRDENRVAEPDLGCKLALEAFQEAHDLYASALMRAGTGPLSPSRVERGLSSAEQIGAYKVDFHVRRGSALLRAALRDRRFGCSPHRDVLQKAIEEIAAARRLAPESEEVARLQGWAYSLCRPQKR